MRHSRNRPRALARLRSPRIPRGMKLSTVLKFSILSSCAAVFACSESAGTLTPDTVSSAFDSGTPAPVPSGTSPASPDASMPVSDAAVLSDASASSDATMRDPLAPACFTPGAQNVQYPPGTKTARTPGVCTAAVIQAGIAACFGMEPPTNPQCVSFKSANAACASCMFGMAGNAPVVTFIPDPMDPTLGLNAVQDMLCQANVAGCSAVDVLAGVNQKSCKGSFCYQACGANTQACLAYAGSKPPCSTLPQVSAACTAKITASQANVDATCAGTTGAERERKIAQYMCGTP
jgi:hypothetical protein